MTSNTVIAELPAGVKSSERTLDILELLASIDERLTLSEIARRLSMPKSSLHKLLATMERRGWVETDDISHTRYRIGLRALLAGTRYVDIDEVVQLALPVLTSLTEELQEASHLGRLDGSDVVYLAKRESSHPLRMFSAVGRRLPAHATAMGKAMLSLLPWNEVSGLLPPKLEKLTERTIVSRPALQKELELTRTRGYAIDDEESAELMRAVAVALPVQGSSNAISVSAPSARLPMDNVPQVAELLRSKMVQFPLR
jgi:DNA-binding IclR family transcriptional regulator